MRGGAEANRLILSSFGDYPFGWPPALQLPVMQALFRILTALHDAGNLFIIGSGFVVLAVLLRKKFSA